MPDSSIRGAAVRNHVSPKKSTLVVLLLLLSIVSAACGSDGGDSKKDRAKDSEKANVAPTKVRFALPVSPPDEGQIWAFVPGGAGYFKEEGLDVEFIPSDGGTAALRQVATGNADFSVNNPQAIINGVGEGLDVVGVATVLPRQIYGFFVLENSPIKTYEDLRGKKVGLSAFTSGGFPFAQVGLEENGIDAGTENRKGDVELVTTGAGGPALQALLSGSVDALVTWDTQVAVFKLLGTTLRELPEVSLADLPADLITTTGKMLKENPEVVERFSRAVLKGIVYAQKHPKEALAFFRQQYPESGGQGTTEEESLSILAARAKTMSISKAQKKYGDIPYDDYGSLQKINLKQGAIKVEQDVRKVFVDSLLDGIQDFDPASL